MSDPVDSDDFHELRDIFQGADDFPFIEQGAHLWAMASSFLLTSIWVRGEDSFVHTAVRLSDLQSAPAR